MVRSQPDGDSEEESRTRSLGLKRSARSDRSPQHMSSARSSVSGAHRMHMSDQSSDAGDSDSSRDVVSSADSHSRYSAGLDGSTNEPTISTRRLHNDGPELGSNRLAVGFSRPHGLSNSNAQAVAPQTSQSRSGSHTSPGESVSDAIEISDDSDAETDDESDDGGMTINVEDNDDQVHPTDHQAQHSKTCHFRVTGWAQSKTMSKSNGAMSTLYLFLGQNATPPGAPRMVFLRFVREADAVLITVRPQDAAGLASLDGRKFNGSRLQVQRIPDVEPSHDDVEMSEGEVEDDETPVQTQPPLRRCHRCNEPGHKAKRCPHAKPYSPSLGSAPASKDLTHNTHKQPQGDFESSIRPSLPSIPSTDFSDSRPRLGDLSPDEYQQQLTYTLFYLDHDQIDPNRPVICTTCLQEGHDSKTCTERNCSYCGARDDHPSRSCALHRRCARCRERGHDKDACSSKLRDTSTPCDLCSSADHVEDACPLRFFPAQPSFGAGEVKLWISCCQCGSKTHLVGDCTQRSTDKAAFWSLKSLDPSQIVNLSLESGTRQLEKQAENRGMRPEGLRIKGRADSYIPKQSSRPDDNDEPFIRPRVGRQNNNSNNNPRRAGHIRFDNRGFELDYSNNSRRQQQHDDDDHYSSRRPPPPQDFRFNAPRQNDRYESSYSDYRDHPPPPPSYNRGDQWYATDSFGQRRRSRSPGYNRTGGDTWQPPLPREPLPPLPPASASSSSLSHSSNSNRRQPGLKTGPRSKPPRHSGTDSTRSVAAPQQQQQQEAPDSGVQRDSYRPIKFHL